MFEWEFPPHFIGGLEKVTYYLSNTLADLGAKISLILPIKGKSNNLKIIPTNFVKIKGIKTLFYPNTSTLPLVGRFIFLKFPDILFLVCSYPELFLPEFLFARRE